MTQATAATSAGGFGSPCEWVFVDGEVVPDDEAAVSVHAHALSYGTGTFEGIRAWWNADREQLYLMEGHAHYERLARSARILGLPLAMSPDALVRATVDLLRRNEVRANAYVRPLLVQAGAALPVRMHDVETRLSIAITPTPGDYINPDGVRCMVSSWRRAPDVSAPNRAKVTGSYTGPALAKTEATAHGFDEAIMLTVDGFVAEATTSNIFVRLGEEWVTPPGTEDILEGITRAEVMTLLAEELGRPVTQRRVHRSELYTSDEILLTGTAAVVVPVVEVDGRPVGDGKPGETTQTLNQTIRAIGRGDDPRHPEWTTPVYDEEPS
ncbi:MAG TPA: branched-chain amino acid transaminase [Pseudonocardia sp.]|uniref:branched-chain amino acid transaminase n=1 Tax=Pseudonocardia sp. TaxID=60912 RepID=UPI002B4B2560|nr:branched-chain amino acid transaminase [Pseudonocardia sp.]HLU55962.1 branched-chain amino acid transaminase [Pseudonocardia sp.]